MKKDNAYSLSEILITLVVISILIATSIPLITQFSSSKTGKDKNVISCIANNNTAAWYNTVSGNTSVPSSATNPKCYAAVTDTQFDRGKAYNTVVWYANKGTSAQQIVAKKILRAACDQGGTKACDYFINKCQTDGNGNNSPYCDDASSYLDITYYLLLTLEANTNKGIDYIISQLTNLATKAVPNLVYEIMNDCKNYPNSLACSIPTGPFDPDNSHTTFYTTCKNPTVTTFVGNFKVTNCNVAKNPRANEINQASGARCWYGKGTVCSGGLGTSLGCGNDLGNIDGDANHEYDKFLCTHDGAVAACEGLNLGINYGTGCGTATGCDPSTKGWRLPTNSELDLFFPPSPMPGFIPPPNPLGLCDSSSFKSPYCNSSFGACNGSPGGCYPMYLWSGDSDSGSYYSYSLQTGSWSNAGNSGFSTNPFSVRCVRTL